MEISLLAIIATFVFLALIKKKGQKWF